MRDHELELIAALVEGRLDDETEARALIASSPEAREEYEAQKLVHESLRALGTARLTESERTALHRDVWTELRVGTTSEKRRTPWSYRWVPVVAGLFVIVGLAAVLSGGGQDAGGAFEDIAESLSDGGDESAPTSTAAGATGLDADGTDDAADAAATDTTEASSEATTTAADSALAASVYEAEATKVREGDYSGRVQLYEESDAVDVQACLEQADLTNFSPIGTLTPSEGEASAVAESVVIAAPERSDLARAPLAFVDLETCELLYLDESPD